MDSKTWKGLVFNLDKDSGEWRCRPKELELELDAWPVSEVWLAMITVKGCDAEYEYTGNGHGRGFKSALNAALRDLKYDLKSARKRQSELQEEMDLVEEEVRELSYAIGTIEEVA
jgi:hypothetical protein